LVLLVKMKNPAIGGLSVLPVLTFD